MLENVSLAFQGIWSHKLRSLLTMLGIIIGIAAIITIVSTIKGTNEQIKQNLIGAGNNAVVVRLYQDQNPVEMQYASIPDGIFEVTEDTRAELEKLSGVKNVSLYRSRSYVEGVYYMNSSFNGELYGVDSRYFDVYGYEISYGRSFIQRDFDDYAKVAILDTKAVASLFDSENPVGKTLEIQGEPYTIIGVVAQSNEFKPTINSFEDYQMYQDTSSGRVFINGATWPIIYRYDEPQSVALQAASTDDMTRVGNAAAELLTERQISSENANKYSYASQDRLEQAKQLQELSSSTNRQLIWIASISLLVGGIGVMNIMLVSVTERTSEIGLKKAIGAKRKRILWQFLTEAAVLTSLGGIVGVVAGIALAEVLSRISSTPVAISVPAIVIAVLFSMFVGVVFGLLPAVKASRLNPIEALRRE